LFLTPPMEIILKYFFVLGFVVLINIPSQAQRVMTERELIQYTQQKNQEVAEIWQAKQYQRAVAILETLYTTPWFSKLEGEWVGTLYNLACGYSLLGEKEKAIDYLGQAVKAGYSDVEHMRKDTDLDNIRQDERFLEIMAKLKARWSFWENAVFKTPYQENISEDEKVAGLSRFWSEVKYNFVYFDRVPGLNWDSLYIAYLPKVRETKSTAEYLLLLERMAAELKDGHTRVEAPNDLLNELYARPAIETRLVEEKVIITEVIDQNLLKSGLRSGLEIIAVDGVPVIRYAQQQVQPYVSASTPQGLAYLVYSLYFLCGSTSQPIKLTIQNTRGRNLEVELLRKWRSFIPNPSVLYHRLKGDVAYLSLRTFGDKNLTQTFDSLFYDIKAASALVIDIRQNAGGNSQLGYEILSYLIDTAFTTATVETQDYSAWRRFQGLGPRWSATHWTQQPNQSKHFQGPVALLIGPATGSAAEDFAVAFHSVKRGILVGEPTSGSTGQPIWFSLPGGISGQVCTNRTKYPDGKEFVGLGIQPDILVHPTVKDVRSGRDTVLETALNTLEKELRKNSRK